MEKLTKDQIDVPHPTTFLQSCSGFLRVLYSFITKFRLSQNYKKESFPTFSKFEQEESITLFRSIPVQS